MPPRKKKPTIQTSIKQHFTRSAAASKPNCLDPGPGSDTALLSMAEEPITLAALDARLEALTITLNQTIKDSVRETIAAELNTRVEEIIAPVRAVAENAASKVAALESRVANNEVTAGGNFTRVNDLMPKVTTIEKKMGQMEERLEFLESFSRRSNVRAFNIVERSDTNTDPVAFMSKLLFDLAGNEVFQTAPELERAHRVGSRQDDAPRAYIMKFLRYQDKTRFMAWSKGKNLTFAGNQIRFVHDLTRQQAKSRGAYKDVKQTLYNKNIKFGHPEHGKLRVTLNEVPHTFDTPGAVQKFIEDNGLDTLG